MFFVKKNCFPILQKTNIKNNSPYSVNKTPKDGGLGNANKLDSPENKMAKVGLSKVEPILVNRFEIMSKF